MIKSFDFQKGLQVLPKTQSNRKNISSQKTKTQKTKPQKQNKQKQKNPQTCWFVFFFLL